MRRGALLSSCKSGKGSPEMRFALNSGVLSSFFNHSFAFFFYRLTSKLRIMYTSFSTSYILSLQSGA
jgi:hypothetical protein